jgi:hypothetical protein
MDMGSGLAKIRDKAVLIKSTLLSRNQRGCVAEKALYTMFNQFLIGWPLDSPDEDVNGRIIWKERIGSR